MKLIHWTFAAIVPWQAGCVATSPGWEANFGDAARQARAAQVIDPNAPTRHTGHGTTDGKAVAGAQRGYSKSYGYAVEEAPQPSLQLNTTVGK
jgi:hypothetical protein